MQVLILTIDPNCFNLCVKSECDVRFSKRSFTEKVKKVRGPPNHSEKKETRNLNSEE